MIIILLLLKTQREKNLGSLYDKIMVLWNGGQKGESKS